MYEIVDIVFVSTEPPLGVDHEQLSEEEKDFVVVEEGKWSSPPACSSFVLDNCITLKFTFMMILH
jgi:hypothetical protein